MDNAAKNGFFLRTVVFAIICTFSFFVPLNTAIAATDNQTSGEIMTPQVAAENLKVESLLSGGAPIPFSFTLNNVENRGFFDIGYRVYVLNGKKDIYLQKDFPKLFTLFAFEKHNIEASLDLPKTIPSGDYVLQVEAISPSGAGLGAVQAKVKIGGMDVGSVTFGTVSISSGSQKSPDVGGIAVNPGDDIVANITVNSKRELTVREQYKIYPEENFSEGVLVEGGQRLIKSGLGKYDFSVKSPENGGNFTMAYWLVDSDGQQVSPIKKFMWGAWGATPAINYLAVDKTSAKKGENVDVEVALIPPVARENIGEVTVKVWVGDSYSGKNLDFSKSAVVLVPVLLKGDVDKPVIRVLAEKDGKTILDYKTISKGALLKNNQAETVNGPKSNSMLYLVLGMFFVASLVFAFYFVKSRKNAAKIVVFLLFGFTFIFFAHKDAFATMTSGASWGTIPSISGSCSPASSYFYVQNFLIYKNGSGTAATQDTIFRPGDTIRFNGNMRPGSGSCTYFGSGSATHRIGSVDLGGTSGQSWDVTYTIPATYDNITYKNTYARTSWYGDIRSTSTAGTVNAYKTMAITMGPQAVVDTTMSATVPSCSSANYNTTFNFTGRALAENYDITWATDAGFTVGVGTVTTALSGSGAKSFTTTTAPFAVGSTYYWRVNAYNSIAGSSVVTNAASTFGPVANCPPDLAIRNFADGTSPAVNVTAPATISGTTITVPTATSFTISFNTRNIGTGSSVNNSRTVAENFSASASTYNQWTVANLAPNTSSAHSFTTSYATAGTFVNAILFRVDADGNVAEGAGETNNDVNLTITVTAPPVPTNPSDLTVATSCNVVNPEVLFTFNDNSASEDLFWLDVNGAAWTGDATPSPWGVKTITRSAAEKSATGAVTFTWSASSALDAGGDVDSVTAGLQVTPNNNKTYYWRVRAHSNTDGDSAHIYPPNSTVVAGTSFITPVCLGAPTGLTVTNPLPCALGTAAPDNYIGGSDSSKKVTFGWAAASGAVTSYEIRVTSSVATNLYDPSGGWAFATVPSGTLSVDSSGNPPSTNPPKWGSSPVTSFTYKNSTKQFVENSLVGASNLTGVPANGFGGSEYGEIHMKVGSSGTPTTYNFMVIAKNGGVSSASSKLAFTVNQCPAQLDLQVIEFVPGTWKDSATNTSVDPTVGFQPREKIKVDVKVQNAATSSGNSPATFLDFYYLSTLSRPNCPGTAITSAPTDGATPAVSQRYSVPTLAPNAFTTIPVEFTIGATGSTAYAYIDPGCNISDTDSSNNFKQQTYLTNTVGFVETQGGDVGAAVGKEIRMAFDSSVIPKYQSDYVIAAGTIGSNVSSKNNWKLNNYDKRQAPSQGIYDLFATKFKPAGDVNCSFAGTETIRRCSGNLTFNLPDTQVPSGNTVYFVDGNLQIKRNLPLAASTDSIVFIVRGDITVDTSVNRIDGIYIARHSFIDHDTADPALASQADALTVNGAIYVDGLTDAINTTPGTIEIGRYFGTAINNQYAPVKVVYDPKYLLLMRDLIGVKSIVWKEVAP